MLADNISVLSKEAATLLTSQDVHKMKQFRATKKFVCHTDTWTDKQTDRQTEKRVCYLCVF